jgi:hypothetical protein
MRKARRLPIMTELVFLLLIPVICIAVARYPFRVYARDAELAESKWIAPVPPLHVRVHESGAGGAYRSGGNILDVEPTHEAIPKLPRRLALWCLCLGAAAALSLPVLAFGVVAEDNFALLFGIPGIPLAIITWIVGRRLQSGFAQHTRLFKFTAVWTALHNATLLVTTLIASAPSTDDGSGLRRTPITLQNLRQAPFGSLDHPLMALVAACVASSMLVLAYQLWKVATQQAAYARNSELSQARYRSAIANVAASKHVTESQPPTQEAPAAKVRVELFADEIVAPAAPIAHEVDETELAPPARNAKQIR